MNRTDEVEVLVKAARSLRGLAEAVATDERRPSNLAYCILSAIYSVGATNRSWTNVVSRYRDYYGLPPFDFQDVPAGAVEPTVSAFIGQIETLGVNRFASGVLRNVRPTSATNGILRAAAALDYAKVLRNQGVERIPDVGKVSDIAALEAALRGVHGQGSGVSTKWFLMSAGVKTLIKPDRWILRFLHRTLGRVVSATDAQTLFTAACVELATDYPGITPRALDLLVWSTERSRQESGRTIETGHTSNRVEELQLRLSKLERRVAELEQWRSRADAPVN